MKQLMFTPGPTDVPPKVLKAMSRQLINPDIDEHFFQIYDSLCNKIRKVAGTKSTVFVMAGEGMVGLDSAVANLVEPREKVLAMSSGVFGDGFVDLIRNYGGKPVVVRSEYDGVVTPNQVERALEKNSEIKVATFVHCETPSGTISPIKEIGKVCHDHGVLLIADAVSSLAGIPVNADKNHIDICLGASQKCFSAPPGLATISISDQAWEKIQRRKTRLQSFYLDLLQWKKMWLGERTFPYTQSVSDIFGLDTALDLILNEGLEAVYNRHAKVAEFVRMSCEEKGLKLFPIRPEIYSDTVTAFKVPRGLDEAKLREKMRVNYGVVIAGSWGKLTGRVLRLGHMGYNAKKKKAERAVNALFKSMDSLR